MGRFTVTHSSSEREALHQIEHPLSRSYGANLPSSLTKVLSSALGYSPRPPVSVFSTDTPRLERLEDFLESSDSHFSTNGLVITSGITVADFPTTHPRA